MALPQRGKTCIEQHLSAQGLDLTADRKDHSAQQIGSHMGLLLPRDLGRCAMLQKCVRDKAAQFVPDTRGQLAVRKSSCAALTKLNVRIRVQDTGGRKALHRLHTLGQGGAALKHQRIKPLPGQHQRSKQARRAKAAHHRACGQFLRAVLDQKFRLCCKRRVAAARCGSGLLPGLFQRDRHGAYKARLAMTGIHRQLGHVAFLHLRRRKL